MILLPPGPSPNGLSTLLRANGCLRKAALFDEDERNGVVYPSPKWAAIGIKGHALLEHYHTGRLALSELAGVTFGPEGHSALIGPEAEETTAEAKRIGLWYMTEFPASRFGTIVGAEVDLGPVVGLSFEGLPSIFDGLTARLDLVTDLPEGALEGVPAGRYIIDHKFLQSVGTENKPKDFTSYLRSLQAIWYCRAWELQTGERADGFLFNFISKTQKPQNVIRWRPFPEEDEIEALGTLLAVMQERIVREGPWANAAMCYDDFGKECPFLTNGRCPRY